MDDFADAGDIATHSNTNVLTSLFVRGRHLGCSCWLLTHKQKVLSAIMRTNLCWLLVWRLRNSKELTDILEELDALHDRKVLMAMYQLVTSKKHDFWHVNLLSDKQHMSHKNFEHRMVAN